MENCKHHNSMRKRALSRHGASAVEAVMVAPVLVIVLLGAIDIGQYVNVAQTVSNASRESARFACRHDTTTVSAVKSHVTAYLANAFPSLTVQEIQAATVVTITDVAEDDVINADLTTIESGAAMSILVDFDFAAVRWLKNIDYWDIDQKGATTVVRRE